MSPAARAEWLSLVPALHGAGTLAHLDLRALETLVETLATEAQARAIVMRDGLSVATIDGGSKPSPALRALEKARDQLVRLFAEFGLTPRSRTSIAPAPIAPGTDNGEPPDAFDEFLARGPRGLNG